MSFSKGPALCLFFKITFDCEYLLYEIDIRMLAFPQNLSCRIIPCSTIGPVYNKNWRNSVAFQYIISLRLLGFLTNSLGVRSLIFINNSEIC